MNETENTMQHALPNSQLTAHSKALEAAGLSIELVTRVPALLKSIAPGVDSTEMSVRAGRGLCSRLRSLMLSTAAVAVHGRGRHRG